MDYVSKKPFVILCGPGRAGSSLGMSLVEACNYNLGVCLPPNRAGSLRHGYGEHKLSNVNNPHIDEAIDKLEVEGCNALKLIHLHAPWAIKLKARGYDVRLVVVSRPLEEIWASGRDIYPDWRPEALSKICGEAQFIQNKTQEYLNNPKHEAYHLPFHKVIQRDEDTLLGLIDFLTNNKEERYAILYRLRQIIKPDIVKHLKEK